MARPTKYKAEYVKIARKFCELGATDREVCEALGIAKDTLYQWRARHPAFAAAFKDGKELSDNRVERSLYEKATGYSFESEKVFQFQGQVIRAPTIEHVPPDTTACIFWLKNRKPDQYRANDKGEGAAEDVAEAMRQLVSRLPE